MATTPTLQAEPIADDALARHAAAIDEQGFTVLEGVVPDDFRLALIDTIDRCMVELDIPYGTNAFIGRHSRRIFNLLARDPLFQQVPTHPGVLPLVDRVLGGQCLLSSITAIEMNPGQAAQALHADDGSITLPRPHVPIVVPAIWALSPFTERNGGTRIVLGSHRWDRRPDPGETAETIGVELSAGSVLVYNGSIWHGGGNNNDDARRLGIVVNYCAGYMRQEENQLLALPRDLVATFPRQLQQLVGYGVFRGLMGHVDTQDPGTLLDPNIETRMIWRKLV